MSLLNIQVLSDLHFEFHRDGGRSFVESLNPDGVDVLVLAGDIGVFQGGSLEHGISLLTDRYVDTPILMVCGNHEYYGSTPGDVWAGMEQLERAFPNFYWLENRRLEIKDQVFLGGTLWFPDMPDGINHLYSGMMYDFTKIRGFRDWVYGQNASTMTFLKENVSPGDVVITHHIPTKHGVSSRWQSQKDGFGRFFLCQMPENTLQTPSLWVYGHTHDSMDFTLGNTRFVCNPFGYVGGEENSSFHEALMVEVP